MALLDVGTKILKSDKVLTDSKQERTSKEGSWCCIENRIQERKRGIHIVEVYLEQIFCILWSDDPSGEDSRPLVLGKLQPTSQCV